MDFYSAQKGSSHKQRAFPINEQSGKRPTPRTHQAQLAQIFECCAHNWLPSIANIGVHNLANYQLTEREQIALSLGLEYIPVPQCNRVGLCDDITRSFADFRRRIRNAHFFSENPLLSTFDSTFTAPSCWEPPATSRNAHVEEYLSRVNATLLERSKAALQKSFNVKFNPAWLMPTIVSLSNNKDIVVTPADKNMGTAVVLTLDYIKEAVRQLSDNNTYRRVDAYDQEQTWQALITILERYDIVRLNGHDEIEFVNKRYAKYFLQLRGSSTCRTAHFYLLMKVHKRIPDGQTIPPGRPIVSSINSTTYHASQFVDKKLQPLLRYLFSFVASSQHLIYQLSTHDPFPADCVILCADIESLYPNIPTDDGLQRFRTSINFYNKQPRIPAQHRLSETEIALILDLTSFVLKNNTFTFGDAVYTQLNGTAMGTPLAVVYACMVIDNIERSVLSTNRNLSPLFFRRYIDDYFIIMKSKEAATAFIEAFNSIIPSIRCPEPVISDTEGVMLDLTISKGQDFPNTGKFQTNLFQKTQNKYLYLPPSSYHSPHVFPAFVIAEIKRYRLHCSRDEDFITACNNFRQRLLDRGFDSAKLSTWFNTAFRTSRTALLQGLEARFKRASQSLSRPSPPLLFKTTATPQIRWMNTTKCLQPDNDLAETGSPVSELFHENGTPITCYKNAHSLAYSLNKSRKSLHNLSVVALSNGT